MPLLLGSEEHTSELQSPCNLVCRLLLESEKDTSELQAPCNLVCRPLLGELSVVLKDSWDVFCEVLRSWGDLGTGARFLPLHLNSPANVRIAYRQRPDF